LIDAANLERGAWGSRALPLEIAQPEFLAFRSSVRPGITGLWQIDGRSNADPASIEMYDLKYLTHWSLGGDLLLLCRTVACVFRDSGL